MENIIYKLINEFTEGVDTYTHNDSTWLIFTESKQWVIELTKEKTLWYNYNFFKEVFKYTSMDVVEHQQYITKWVEDKIIDGVNRIKYNQSHQEPKFKEVLQNGVKKTNVCNYVNPDDGLMWIKWDYQIDDVIENGVKETNPIGNESSNIPTLIINHIIKNGVKVSGTFVGGKRQKENVDVVINCGVKETKGDASQNPMGKVTKVIKEGIKNPTY